jgi:acyl carrier protein
MQGSNDRTTSPEEYLRDLWIKMLDVETIHIDDDFFILGGSSMKVIEMLVLVSAQYNKEIEVVEFFKNPTISNLCGLLGSQE